MIPGSISKITERVAPATAGATIPITTDLTHVTGAGALTIKLGANFAGGFPGICWIANRLTSGALTIDTTVLQGGTMVIPANMTGTLIYSKLLGKWLAGPIS